MAGGLVHDFNNFLAGALGNAEMALRCVAPSTPEHTYVTAFRDAALQGAELCKQLLTYTGKGQILVSEVDLSATIDKMLPLLKSTIPKNITIRSRLKSNLPLVSVDESQIQQHVMSVVTNALEAIGPEEGVITISTDLVDCDDAFLQSPFVDEILPEGKYISFEIADTGPGMDEQTLSQIFDPFFSTKFTGRGMGLAALMGIVRRHKGTIKVDSTPGEGTRFTVLIPISEPAIAQTQNNLDTPSEWSGTGTALVVEDEPVVQELTKALLESAGFKVLTAADGQQGVDLFRDHAEDLSVVILDMMMPVMGGHQAFNEMRAINDKVPVICFSGYNDAETADLFADMEPAGFIQKPFRIDNFMTTVRQTIDNYSH